MGVKRGAPGSGLRINDLLGACEELVPGRGSSVGNAGLAGDARMPRRAYDIEEERPAVELSVDGTFRANRRDDVVDPVLRDVVVPRLDDAGFDERGHLNKRRLPDIDVPCALAALRFGDKALDAEALDRRDLIVDPGELLVDVDDTRMQVLNPLVDGRRERSVRCERWRNA